MSETPGWDPARIAQLLSAMERMLLLMERFLERTAAPGAAR